MTVYEAALFWHTVVRLAWPDIDHTATCRHVRLAERYAPIIVQESERYGIDPVAVAALISHESGFRSRAVGAHGEIGLMQVKPDGHAVRLCPREVQRLRNPRLNIRCGVRILSYMVKRCGGSMSRALTAYNNGGGCWEGGYTRRVLARLP